MRHGIVEAHMKDISKCLCLLHSMTWVTMFFPSKLGICIPTENDMHAGYRVTPQTLCQTSRGELVPMPWYTCMHGTPHSSYSPSTSTCTLLWKGTNRNYLLEVVSSKKCNIARGTATHVAGWMATKHTDAGAKTSYMSLQKSPLKMHVAVWWGASWWMSICT